MGNLTPHVPRPETRFKVGSSVSAYSLSSTYALNASASAQYHYLSGVREMV